MQVLWLRVLHRLGRLDDGVSWAYGNEAGLAPEALGVASLMAFDAGRTGEAERWSQCAIREDAGPIPIEALITQASLQLAAGDTESARYLIDRALEQNAEDGRTWSTKGFVELLDQHFPLAENAFYRAVRFMPMHIGTWNGLGWTAIMNRKYGEATQAFERALEIDRNFAESHGGLAVAHALCGKVDLARISIARAEGLDKDGLAARYANAILSGEAADSQAIRRLAKRLLTLRIGSTGQQLLGNLLKRVESGS